MPTRRQLLAQAFALITTTLPTASHARPRKTSTPLVDRSHLSAIGSGYRIDPYLRRRVRD